MTAVGPLLSPVALDTASPTQAVATALSRISRSDAIIKAWVHINADAARSAAKERERLAAQVRGPLEAVVVGVKDVIDVRGLPTRAGSAGLAEVEPAREDATVVSRLRDAGAIILGKVKTTEFAYLDPADTVNPANPLHTPGGSSSGSAAAVAAGHVPLALGTQTVGSVCRPAAYCGVAAFKPTTGSMPSRGVIPFGRTFDTVGFLANTLDLAITAFRVCANARWEDIPACKTRKNLHGVRVGILRNAFYTDIDPACALALKRAEVLLQSHGATIVSLSAPDDFQAMRDSQRTVMFREAALAHQHLLNKETEPLLGQNWRNALRSGLAVDDTQYWHARDALVDARQGLAQLFSDVDFLLLPPVKTPAPAGLTSTGDAGLIVPWTILGSPLAVVPAGKNEQGLPLAVMVAGVPWKDSATGAFAVFLESLLAQH